MGHRGIGAPDTGTRYLLLVALACVVVGAAVCFFLTFLGPLMDLL